MPERDPSIDSIRSIGLFCIILAHVSPPFLLFQIRNFDVPLMVFISGYLFGSKDQKFQSLQDFGSYLGKRFVRLVLPVWIFLIFFYTFQYVFPSLFDVNYSQYPDKMLSSFLLMQGFGYVWIIRIFLMIAILGPLFRNFIKNGGHLLAYYCGYELLVYATEGLFMPSVQSLMEEIILYSLGFLVFFLLGSQYANYGRKTKFKLWLGTLLLSLFGLAYHNFYLHIPFDIGALKYPPHGYYSYYAILVISIIFLLKPRLEKVKSSLLSFVGSSTIWIYLWHIFFLMLLDFGTWYYNWIAILALSICTTYLQQNIVQFLLRYFKVSEKNAKQYRIIFCS